MSYPEGLRNYKGPWPPQKDATRSAKVMPPWLKQAGKVVDIIGLVFRDINLDRVPVLDVLMYVPKLVFPVIWRQSQS